MLFKTKILAASLALTTSLCGLSAAGPLSGVLQREISRPMLTFRWSGPKESVSAPAARAPASPARLFETGKKWGVGDWGVVGAVVVGLAAIVIIASSHKGGGGGGGGTTGY